MMSPPSPAVEGQRVTPTPFLSKTYQLVDDPSVDDVISWSGDGSTFIVWSPAEFARDVLPKYFKHNNFSSFVRQLNTYGFRKIVPDRWEFANDCFRRGEKRLLCDIQRRKMAPPTAAAATPTAGASSSNSGDLSSNSSPGPQAAAVAGSAVDLADENGRLRRENAQISRELAKMKELCNNIVGLMTRYMAGRGGSGECGAEMESLQLQPTSTLLDLMPAGRSKLEVDDDAEETLELKPETAILQLASRYIVSPPAPSTVLGLTPPAVAAKVQQRDEDAVVVSTRGETTAEEALLFGVRIGLKREREEDGEGAETKILISDPEKLRRSSRPGKEPVGRTCWST